MGTPAQALSPAPGGAGTPSSSSGHGTTGSPWQCGTHGCSGAGDTQHGGGARVWHHPHHSGPAAKCAPLQDLIKCGWLGVSGWGAVGLALPQGPGAVAVPWDTAGRDQGLWPSLGHHGQGARAVAVAGATSDSPFTLPQGKMHPTHISPSGAATAAQSGFPAPTLWHRSGPMSLLSPSAGSFLLPVSRTVPRLPRCQWQDSHLGTSPDPMSLSHRIVPHLCQLWPDLCPLLVWRLLQG